MLTAPFSESGAVVEATLVARSWQRPAKFAAFVQVTVPASGTARGAIRRLGDELTRRGYEHTAGHIPRVPIWARRNLSPTQLAGERAYLAHLLGAADDVPRSAPKDVRGFVAFFSGDRSGPWHPARASWEQRRPIVVGGRDAEAVLMVHLYPGSRRGASGSVLATSVAIWPPWNGTGDFPAWLTDRRRLLARQFRAIGHRAEWVRGPRDRGVGIMSLVDQPSSARVGKVRRLLDQAVLGDVPEAE